MEKCKWTVRITEAQFDKMTAEELWRHLKFIRPAGQIMYDAFGEINNILKPYCKRDKKRKKDPYFEEQLVAMHIRDPFDPFDLINASRVVGRTPLATFCIWCDYIWREAREGRRAALKKTVRKAIKHGYVSKQVVK